jgi:hypothetical protein
MALIKRSLTAALLASAAMFGTASADTAGVKAGVLTCNVEGGTGFIFGSSKDLVCVYSPEKGSEDTYYGSVDKFGIDIGYTESSRIVWVVLAPASDVADGALEGTYAGATIGASAGVGGSVNVLVGGLDQSITLQPLSVEGTEGINVAAGIESIRLHSSPPS